MAEKSKELILTAVSLPSATEQKLAQPTPKDFIKVRDGKGGRKFTYVEVGYVIARLNEAFGRLNWDFKVLERGETNRKTEASTEGEVWVYGELSVKDHKNGYSVTKGAYGQHQLYKSTTFGDGLKAAESDALKKAASLFGVCLDVFWQQLDNQEDKPKKPATKAVNNQKVDDIFANSKRYIEQQNDVNVLRQLKERLEANGDFTVAQKVQLGKLIDGKINRK